MALSRMTSANFSAESIFRPVFPLLQGSASASASALDRIAVRAAAAWRRMSAPTKFSGLDAIKRGNMRPFTQIRRVGRLGALLLAITISAAAHGQSVLTYHGSPDRSGNFVVPALTWERARSVHLDPGFHPRISGHLYAQPLYWRPPGSAAGQLLVATEDNNVYAIDAGSGREIWVRSLGRSVPLSTLECGNIDPLGITGTPVIDEATQAIYIAAMVDDTA